jgi:hypothetical protein
MYLPAAVEIYETRHLSTSFPAAEGPKCADLLHL